MRSPSTIAAELKALHTSSSLAYVPTPVARALELTVEFVDACGAVMTDQEARIAALELSVDPSPAPVWPNDPAPAPAPAPAGGTVIPWPGTAQAPAPQADPAA